MRTYYVYILSSSGGTLYTGITNNIWFRVLSHKSKKQPGFTRRHNITRLVYYEETRYVSDALAGEKEIKGWRRRKKIQLIELLNPKWEDFAEYWYDEEDYFS